jgi:hypothetical protein
MSEFAMNSVHAADWMLLRSDGDRETYIDMSRSHRSGRQIIGRTVCA